MPEKKTVLKKVEKNREKKTERKRANK